MVKNEGIRGFYRGLTPALVQVAPYSGFQFAFYTMLEKVWLYSFRSKGKIASLKWINFRRTERLEKGILQSVEKAKISNCS